MKQEGLLGSFRVCGGARAAYTIDVSVSEQPELVVKVARRGAMTNGFYLSEATTVVLLMGILCSTLYIDAER